ncbi:MAG: STAS domain-containing protein [Pseudomonadota bacterium]
MNKQSTAIESLLSADLDKFVAAWLAAARTQHGAGKAAEEARALVATVLEGIRADGEPAQFADAAWAGLRKVLANVSATRAAQGATAGDTSMFVLAMKQPLFQAMRQHYGNSDAASLMDTVIWSTSLIDQMAQHTVTAYQKSREDIIRRQQDELLELSTPVIKLWDGVLAVPMIGTLDSGRTQQVMEALLQRIVETGSELAIIDITGVPTVDTLVAQHLLKTVTAIRLMGADCIISGIRPQIAQTIVHLGIDLQGIITKATLADALAVALKKTGYTVTRTAKA